MAVSTHKKLLYICFLTDVNFTDEIPRWPKSWQSTAMWCWPPSWMRTPLSFAIYAHLTLICCLSFICSVLKVSFSKSLPILRIESLISFSGCSPQCKTLIWYALWVSSLLRAKYLVIGQLVAEHLGSMPISLRVAVYPLKSDLSIVSEAKVWNCV